MVNELIDEQPSNAPGAMVSSWSGKLKVARFPQPLNAKSPMCRTVLGRIMVDILELVANLEGITLTSLPIVIWLMFDVYILPFDQHSWAFHARVFRLLQPAKALSPIAQTALGIDTAVRLVQLLKAFFPIEATVLGIVIEVIRDPEAKPSGNNSTSAPMDTVVNLLVYISPLDGQFLAFQVNCVNPVHSENASSPMAVIDSGMVNELKFEQ